MRISVLIVDDHPIVREGLRSLLDKQGHLYVIGECGTGAQALNLIAQLKPDILILDLAMEGISGFEVLHNTPQLSPATKIIILSIYSKEEYVVEAIKHGASGYIIKGSEPEHLLHAIEVVQKGERYLSPPFSEEAIQSYLDKSQAQPFDSLETLTNRERQVLHMVAAGMNSREIADELTISPRTVETHRQNMMRKLKLNNHTEVILFALRKGILEIEGIHPSSPGEDKKTANPQTLP